MDSDYNAVFSRKRRTVGDDAKDRHKHFSRKTWQVAPGAASNSLCQVERASNGTKRVSDPRKSPR
jgi:hypothetical protein